VQATDEFLMHNPIQDGKLESQDKATGQKLFEALPDKYVHPKNPKALPEIHLTS
jgi:hypothetical protein